MIVKSNLHTHTVYCDGQNTPREMVESALEKGFVSLGFSGHSYAEWLSYYCMSKENTEKYISEITQLKKEYQGRIDILLGVEQEFFSDLPQYNYDFTIGSAHAIKIGTDFYTVDDSAKDVEKTVTEFFGGDYYKYAEQYFETVSKIPEKINPSIIGHFDLIAKFNDGGKYFDEDDMRYKSPALNAVKEILKYNIPFEINTGAVYKGYKKSPYPSDLILKKINEWGGEIILSSDSHNSDSLGYGFDDATELAKSCGFKYVKMLTSRGFENIKI